MNFFLKFFNRKFIYNLSFIVLIVIIYLSTTKTKQKYLTLNLKINKIFLLSNLPGENLIFTINNFSPPEVLFLKNKIKNKIKNNFKAELLNFNYNKEKNNLFLKVRFKNISSEKNLRHYLTKEFPATIISFQNNKMENILKSMHQEYNLLLKKKLLSPQQIFDTKTILNLEKIINFKLTILEMNLYLKYFIKENKNVFNNQLTTILSNYQDAFNTKSSLVYEEYFKKNSYDLLELAKARHNLRKKYQELLILTLNQITPDLKISKEELEKYILLNEWQNFISFLQFKINNTTIEFKNNKKYNFAQIKDILDSEIFNRYESFLKTIFTELKNKKINSTDLNSILTEYQKNIIDSILFIFFLFLITCLLIIKLININFLSFLPKLFTLAEVINIKNNIFFANNTKENAQFDYYSLLLKKTISEKNLKSCLICLEDNNYAEFNFFYELIKKLSTDGNKVAIMDLNLTDNSLDWKIASNGNLILEDLLEESLISELKINSIIENNKQYNIQEYFKDKLSLKNKNPFVVTRGKNNSIYLEELAADDNFKILINNLNKRFDYVFFTLPISNFFIFELMQKKLSLQAIIFLLHKKNTFLKFIGLYRTLRKIKKFQYYSLIYLLHK